MIAKQIHIHPYNPMWPKLFTEQADALQNLLGRHYLAVHHIGSTSIPGLSAKEDIDILLVVDDLKQSLQLQGHGYVFKGELNVPLRFYYSRNSPACKVNLHVCEKDHGFIRLNLTFRDALRASTTLRDAYGSLKLSLIQEPRSHEKRPGQFSGYNLGKDAFIKKVLNEAGFQDWMLTFCMHHDEWHHYHLLQGNPTSDPLPHGVDAAHLVLAYGTQIVASAHLRLKDQSATLIKIATSSDGAAHEAHPMMMTLLSQWLRFHGKEWDETGRADKI
ncbi:MAG: GrpB family protein [Holosporales bacterium]